MPISTTTNTVLLAGNGSTVVFPFQFPFYNTTDLQVFLYDTVAGGITKQTLSTNYSVSAVADSTGIFPNGGNILFTSSIVSTSVVVIDRQPIDTQTFNILQNGFISSVGLVHQLDYLTLLIQGLQDQASRALSLPEGFGTTFNTNLPSNIASQSNAFAGCFLGINSTATGIGIVNSSFIPYTPATSGYVLTGNGPNAFPSFNPLVISGSNIAGSLSLSAGGTGGLVPAEWGVVYASSATQLATTGPGPSGLPLMSNQSSAPSFQQIAYSLAGSGVISAALGGTGLTGYTGNKVIQSGSGGLALAESPFAVLGSSMGFGDGSLTIPGLNFLSETNTGWMRTGVNNATLVVGGVAVFDIAKSSSGYNFGFGSTASATATNPFSATYSNNTNVFYQYNNASTGGSSATIFQILNGNASTNVATEIGNNAFATGGSYLVGGGWLTAKSGLTQLNIMSENAAGFIGFNIGGRLLAHERARLSTSSFTLNGGQNLILGGSGASSLSLTLTPTMASRNGDMIYCGSAGVLSQLAVGSNLTILQSNGVGNAPSWVANGSFANPMTTLGDAIYGGASGAATRLAGVTTNSTVFFTQTGSGGLSAAPIWKPITQSTQQIFTGSSSQTYTLPANCKWIEVFGVAGGGGSGGAATGAATGAAGGGGAGGGYFYKIINNPAASYTLTMGGAGQAALAGNNSGGNGGTITFGSSVLTTALIALGGGGGAGSAAAGGIGVTAAGGSGGTSSGGDINLTGGDGGDGFILSITQSFAGYGGVSGGGYGASVRGNATTTANGSPGYNYGGGASGGLQVNNGGNQTGASGGIPLTFIKEYYV